MHNFVLCRKATGTRGYLEDNSTDAKLDYINLESLRYDNNCYLTCKKQYEVRCSAESVRCLFFFSVFFKKICC